MGKRIEFLFPLHILHLLSSYDYEFMIDYDYIVFVIELLVFMGRWAHDLQLPLKDFKGFLRFSRDSWDFLGIFRYFLWQIWDIFTDFSRFFGILQDSSGFGEGFLKIPWDSLGFWGILSDFSGFRGIFSYKFEIFLRIFQDFSGFLMKLWDSLGFQGILGYLEGFLGIFQKFFGFFGIFQDSLSFQGFFWIAADILRDFLAILSEIQSSWGIL